MMALRLGTSLAFRLDSWAIRALSVRALSSSSIVFWETGDGFFQASRRLYNLARLFGLKESQGRRGVNKGEEGKLKQVFKQTPALAGIPFFDKGLSVFLHRVECFGEVGGFWDEFAGVRHSKDIEKNYGRIGSNPGNRFEGPCRPGDVELQRSFNHR